VWINQRLHRYCGGTSHERRAQNIQAEEKISLCYPGVQRSIWIIDDVMEQQVGEKHCYWFGTFRA
jgi:hypothetical protein